MANDKVIFSTNFIDGIEGLQWLHQPAEYKTNATPDGGLKITLDPKTDFWRKTYYQPELNKHTGHLLYYPVKLQDKVVFETKFTLQPKENYDHAGLMVRLNEQHWLKTGIESVDGAARLSAVVTNEYSDWSTEAWPSNELAIRVYKLRADIVVEAQYPHKNNQWDFFRIARLHLAGDQDLQVGVFGCSPNEGGGAVTFHYLTVRQTEGYHHHA